MWPNLLCLGKHSIQLKIKKKNIKIKNELIGPNVQLTAVGKFNGQQKGKIGSRKNFDTSFKSTKILTEISGKCCFLS